MSTIKGRCIPNNTGRYAREIWPTKFVAMPRVGQLVRAESGLVLKIVSITHYIARIRGAESWGDGGESFTSVKAPRIEIALAL